MGWTPPHLSGTYVPDWALMTILSVLFWFLSFFPLGVGVIGFAKSLNGCVVLYIVSLDLRQCRLGKCNARFQVLRNGQPCAMCPKTLAVFLVMPAR